MNTAIFSEIEKVSQISAKHIAQFIKTASTDDVLWIKRTKDECAKTIESEVRTDKPNLSAEDVVKQVNLRVFTAFRSEFAKKYIPELYSSKKPTKRDDEIDKAIAEALSKAGVVAV